MLATVLTILTAVRDVVIAAALAWVGVTLESAERNVDGERLCGGEVCQPSGE